MEEAEHALWRSMGLSVHRHPTDVGEVSWPRVSARFDYRKPLRFEEEFEIRIRVAGLGRRSVTFVARITREGEELAVGEIVAVCVAMRPEGFAPVEMPPGIRSALAARLDSAGQEEGRASAT